MVGWSFSVPLWAVLVAVSMVWAPLSVWTDLLPGMPLAISFLLRGRFDYRDRWKWRAVALIVWSANTLALYYFVPRPLPL